MKRGVRIAGNILGWILIVFFALLFLYSLVCRIKGDSVRIFGIQADVVQSGSMEPNLHKNDLIFVRAVTRDEIEIGEILEYKRDGVKYVHRLVRIDGEKYITRGDANSVDDEPVTFPMLEGKVVTVWHGIGGVIQFFQSAWGLIVLGSVCISAVCFTKLIGILKEEKKKSEEDKS